MFPACSKTLRRAGRNWQGARGTGERHLLQCLGALQSLGQRAVCSLELPRERKDPLSQASSNPNICIFLLTSGAGPGTNPYSSFHTYRSGLLYALLALLRRLSRRAQHTALLIKLLECAGLNSSV